MKNESVEKTFFFQIRTTFDLLCSLEKAKETFFHRIQITAEDFSLDFAKQKLNFNDSLQSTDHMCGTNL